MSKSKKTIHVDELKQFANQLLANENLSEQEKLGVTHLIEHVLLNTGNYKGFNYLEWLNGGCKQYFIDKESNTEVKPQKYITKEYTRVYY
jgi:hypothetical protein